MSTSVVSPSAAGCPASPPAANRRRLTALVAMVALASGIGLAGCSLVTAVKKAVSTAQANKAVIDQFTGKLTAGQPAQFAVTYATTGSNPATVIYAVRTPGSLLYSAAQSGSASPLNTARVIINPAGAYTCTKAPAAGWVCDKLTKSGAAAQRKMLSFYTPVHWVQFLEALAVTGGFAGDKVTASTMTVNGISLQCVDLRVAGVAGTSRVCITPQHLPGYVQVAGIPTSFEIKSYSGSPPASLFATPPGAKIIKPQGGGK